MGFNRNDKKFKSKEYREAPCCNNKTNTNPKACYFKDISELYTHPLNYPGLSFSLGKRGLWNEVNALDAKYVLFHDSFRGGFYKQDEQGRYVSFDPKTGQCVGEAGMRRKGKRRQRYRKRKDHKVVGEDEEVVDEDVEVLRGDVYVIHHEFGGLCNNFGMGGECCSLQFVRCGGYCCSFKTLYKGVKEKHSRRKRAFVRRRLAEGKIEDVTDVNAFTTNFWY